MNQARSFFRFFIPLLLFILPAFPAKSGDFVFFAEPILGIRNGQVDEYVFLKKCAYDSDKFSELNWKIKNEFYGGIRTGFEWGNFFSEFSVSGMLFSKKGLMADSDWMNAALANAEDYQYKTNYSESDNFLSSDYSAGAKIGCTFWLFENDFASLSIKPFAGFTFSAIAFDAKNGTAWYGNYIGTYQAPYNDSENSTTIDFSGMNVISYKRKSYIAWLGFDFAAELSEKFIARAGFSFSPYLYAESIDTHHQRSLMFGDKTPGCFGAFDWRLSAEYILSGRFSVLLGAEFFFMRVLRGDSYNKSVSSSEYKLDSTSEGGASSHFLDIALSCKIKLSHNHALSSKTVFR